MKDRPEVSQAIARVRARASNSEGTKAMKVRIPQPSRVCGRANNSDPTDRFFARVRVRPLTRSVDVPWWQWPGERVLCGARRRSDGKPCMARSVPGKRRCKYHGGLSTGPRTFAGKATCTLNLPVRVSPANRRRSGSR